MLRYAQAFLHQTTTTGLANGRSKMEERLARWLLMADDRIDGNELPLTHEFLGLMLGTYRPGVSKAIQALEKEGLIAARRRGISILNRKALEKGRTAPTFPPSAEPRGTVVPKPATPQHLVRTIEKLLQP